MNALPAHLDRARLPRRRLVQIRVLAAGTGLEPLRDASGIHRMIDADFAVLACGIDGGGSAPGWLLPVRAARRPADAARPTLHRGARTVTPLPTASEAKALRPFLERLADPAPDARIHVDETTGEAPAHGHLNARAVEVVAAARANERLPAAAAQRAGSADGRWTTPSSPSPVTNSVCAGR